MSNKYQYFKEMSIFQQMYVNISKKCQYLDELMSIFPKHVNISLNLCPFRGVYRHGGGTCYNLLQLRLPGPASRFIYRRIRRLHKNLTTIQEPDDYTRTRRLHKNPTIIPEPEDYTRTRRLQNYTRNRR